MSCIDADSGHFVSSSGAISQSACPAGTYNPSEASGSAADCIPADLGHYVGNQASSTQTPCSPGTYQDSPGQLSCIDAAPGHYVSVVGLDHQTPAPLDTYATGTASTSTEGCPENYITLQEGADSQDDCFIDSDGDRIHDMADSDDDNDGVVDGTDMCPLGMMGWSSSPGSDNDADGCKDTEEDADDDNDGFPDDGDALPLNPAEHLDNDGDGLGDIEDPDDDNDGLTDADEAIADTDPKDTDTDDDGFGDAVDAFPKDPTEWADTDGGGYGDNGDAFPSDASKHLEEDLFGKYGFVIAILGSILVFGLGGWMVMRRKGDATVTEAAEHTHSVETRTQPAYEPEPEPETNTGQFLEELEADLSRPTAPPHAKMNEQVQLVWVDDAGTVYAQNPDGSMVTFNVSTGLWEPLE